jgi:hypothetical protein
MKIRNQKIKIFFLLYIYIYIHKKHHEFTYNQRRISYIDWRQS